MRNEDVGGEPAIDGDAEMTMVRAQILLAADARGADAASDPGIDRDAMANDRVGRLLSSAFDHAGDLVAKREGQGPSRADVELFIAAEREIAVLQVQIGMAYAATLDAHQHFAAAWRRAVDDGLAQRLPVGDERLAMHLGHGGVLSDGVRRRHHARDRGVRRGPAPAIQSRRPGYPRRAPSGSSRRPREEPRRRRRANAGFDAASCAAGQTRLGSRFRGACDRRATAPIAARDAPGEDVTLGGGTKAEGLTSKRMRASQRHCTSTESRP